MGRGRRKTPGGLPGRRIALKSAIARESDRLGTALALALAYLVFAAVYFGSVIR